MGNTILSFFFFFFFLFLAIPLVLGEYRSSSSSSSDGSERGAQNENNEGWEAWLTHIRETSSGMTTRKVVGFGDQLSLQLDGLNHHGHAKYKRSKRGKYVWRKVVVSKDGHGDYKSIQAAVDSVLPYASNHTHSLQVRTLILIKAGLYREKVNVPKKKQHVTFLGEEGKSVTIVWNDTANTLGSDGLPLRTIHSATVGISARYFAAKNIIFQNDAPPPFLGQIGGQAVALRISGDKAAFFNCHFLGHQDTLYDHRGRHYFQNCNIQGSIDFIFGSGRSLYRRCNIRVIPIGDKMVGSVTAQKRNETYHMDSGFSFVGCNVSGEGWVYLGRAWGTNSRVVFSYTWMDNIVAPGGWNNWGISTRQSGVYYGQFKCSGLGSNMRTRVPWARKLSLMEAKPFLGVWFINGKSWL